MALAGCAPPELPSRPPDFAGMVIAAGTAADGSRGLAVQLRRTGAETQPHVATLPDPGAPIATLELEKGAASAVRDASGAVRRAEPSASWVGRTAWVWVAEPVRAPAGASFEARAAAVLLEPVPSAATDGRGTALP